MVRKSDLLKKMMKYEFAGFFMVLLFLWLNELFDIPNRFLSGRPTPVNIAESIFESFIVIFLWVIVSTTTLKLLKKIRYLEGFLPVCARCKKIRFKDQWVPIEDYIRQHSEAEFTHGICPECEKRIMDKEASS